MDWALKQCTTGRNPACVQCWMCCTSLSGTKSVPSIQQLADTVNLSGIKRRQLLSIMDCPHLTAWRKCGVYEIRQKFPSAFPDCGTFTGQKNGFIWKICISVLNPHGNELDIIYEACNNGNFWGMELSFESHFANYENAFSLWSKCVILFERIKKEKWGPAKTLIYFEKTFLLWYLRKHERKFRALSFTRNIFKQEKTEQEFLNFLFPPSNTGKRHYPDEQHGTEYA